MARIGSFSYGSYVDHLLETHSPSSSFFSGSQGKLLHAIDRGKATYMLVALEEVEQIIHLAKLPQGAFIQITLDEIPYGNFRYLMCGQTVSDSLIERLNKAIETLDLQTD